MLQRRVALGVVIALRLNSGVRRACLLLQAPLIIILCQDIPGVGPRVVFRLTWVRIHTIILTTMITLRQVPPLLPLSDSSHVDNLRSIPSNGAPGAYSYVPANIYDAGHTGSSYKAMVKSESRLPDHQSGVSSAYSTSGSNCRYVTIEGSKDVYNFANASVASHDAGYN